MNNNQLNRVMRLVRRTGDRCVVLDNESDEAVVVLNLDEYERMLDCDENMCSCCEGDCEQNVDNDIDDVLVEQNDGFDVEEDGSQLETEEVKKVDQIMEEIVADLPAIEPKDFANVGQEESLEGVPTEEADRFYLEPVDE